MINKIITITLFLIFSILTSTVNAESLTFPAATYEGEVKKGKAHGVGIFTFSDGSTYEGKVKKNKIHGKGKYTDAQGTVYEGKFKHGSLQMKIDKKTRDVVKLKPKTGFEAAIEIKGKGSASNQWFEAEKNSAGAYEMTAKGASDMAGAIASASTGGSNSSGQSSSSSGGGC